MTWKTKMNGSGMNKRVKNAAAQGRAGRTISAHPRAINP